MQSAVDPKPMAKQPKPPSLAHTEGRGSNNTASLQWQGPAGGRCLPKTLQNCLIFFSLKIERYHTGEMLELNKEPDPITPHITVRATKSRQEVIVVGDSLLRVLFANIRCSLETCAVC